MKTLFAPTLRLSLAAALFVLAGTALASNKQNSLYGLYLLSGDTLSVKLAAKSLFNNPDTSQALADLVAEVLVDDLENANQLDIDTRAWLAKTLGSLNSWRYMQALQRLATTPAAESYVPGSLSLPETLRSLKAEQSRDVLARAEAADMTISDEQGLASILASLGLPNSNETTIGQLALPFSGGWAPSNVEAIQMLLKYDNIGTVQLARSKSHNNA